MGPRLEFVPCGQIPQDEEEEELSSAQLKDRHHVFLIHKVKESFLTVHAEKGSMEVKKWAMLASP